jgi:cell division protein FtsZ
MADDVLYQGVKGVTDLMIRPGIINLDFADIRAVMDEMGKAMMGTGEATGEDRAIQAAEKAIANPLLDEISLKGAHGVLINITGGHDLTLFEMDEAANRIREEVDEEANIIVGSTLDTGLEGVMRVSVVATGIDAALNVNDIPVPRRSMKAPLAQAVSMEQAPEEEVAEETVEAPETVEASKPDLFDAEPEFEEVSLEDDMPPPAYQPETRANAPEDDFFQMEESDERSSFVAPQARPTGQPSAETMARLHAAATKASPKREAQADQTAKQPEKSQGFGLNSLIAKMTGHNDDRGSAPHRAGAQPSMSAMRDELDYEEPAISEDQERIEIPAFLRRQAN